MNFEEWKASYIKDKLRGQPLLLDSIGPLIDAALTAGYQRKVAEREHDALELYQAMIDDLVENVDQFRSAWSVTFIESIAGKKWAELSPKQRAKVEELYEEI